VKSNQRQKNTLYHFLFDREHRNAAGEDGFQILNHSYSQEGLHLNRENADLALRYLDQTTRAIREVILQIVKLRVHGNVFEGDGNLLPKGDGAPFSRKMEQAREDWQGNFNNELPELLINGKIEVVEIIDEY
jgi:hypothetical protein